MSKKHKAIIEGFVRGGATDVMLHNGNGYGRASMVVMGKRCTVFKIPSSSHLDPVALSRKARDYARRFVTYNTTTLTW